jgi:cell division protein FtsA
MANRESYVFALDLGSTKTRALACHPGEGGKLEVAGLGVAESKGWRKGVIANLDATVLAVKKAVEAAEAACGAPVDSAYVGVAGPHVKGVNSRGAVVIGKERRQITHEDIARVIQAARKISLPPDRELLQVWPEDYILDSQNGIRNPVGMVGERLEVDAHLVTVSTTALQNVVTAVNLAGIKVPDGGVLFEPVASADACLTADDRELGVAVADIGGGSTDMIVYYQGTVRHTAVVPVGGEHFTNDIAVGLRTPIPEAEKMKRAWGAPEADHSPGAVLEVPSVGDRPARIVPYSTLSEIVEPRAVELLELIRAEIARSGFERQLGAGVLLAGGGAKLGGLSSLAEQILHLPVRVGVPAGIEKMGESLQDPAFSTVVGLVLHGNRMRLLRDTREKGFLDRVLGAFRGK